MKGNIEVVSNWKPGEVSRRQFLRAGALGLALSSTGWTQSNSGSASTSTEEVGLPANPYSKSQIIKGIRWLSEPLPDANNGDTWGSTWADDDNVYTAGNDTSGTGKDSWNLSIYKVEGVPPKYVVTRINDMEEYDHAGKGHWWKAAGLCSIDGILYMGIYSQSDPRRGSATQASFNADNSSIIMSRDHGKTWKPKATFEAPMFPGKEFPTPYFVQFGKDYAGAMDGYVYLVSNDGGWNNWNKMMLARVPCQKIKELNRADWEFFVGAEKRNEPAWGRDVHKAAAVFGYKGYTGMTGIQYVPATKRFVLAQWSYVAMKGGGDRIDASSPPAWPKEAKYEKADQVMLHLYESPKPWGPWRLFYAQAKWGPAFYNPNFPSKWFEDGGKKMWIVEGGNYRGPEKGYNFTVQQLELIL